MSENINKMTVSGKPRLTFLCNKCGFSGKTSGFPISCPKCHYDPIKEVNRELEEIRESLAAQFEEVKA